MNIMLKQRNLPVIDLERYREIFTFPVRDYYLALGFDFEAEPFEIPAHQFIDLYRISLSSAPLHDDAKDILDYFEKQNVQQVILSAMEHHFLEETLRQKGILQYFTYVGGITNHLGEGKLEMAKELMKSLSTAQQDTFLMIGDTTHDYEVANGSGIPCILIAHGHQSYERLKKPDCIVVNDMKELISFLNDTMTQGRFISFQ
jgi:phosphoglycolate phosphatase